jgi:hypothetical protein
MLDGSSWPRKTAWKQQLAAADWCGRAPRTRLPRHQPGLGMRPGRRRPRPGRCGCPAAEQPLIPGHPTCGPQPWPNSRPLACSSTRPRARPQQVTGPLVNGDFQDRALLKVPGRPWNYSDRACLNYSAAAEFLPSGSALVDDRPQDAGILWCIENDEDLLMDESERAGTSHLHVGFRTSPDALVSEPRLIGSAGTVARFEPHQREEDTGQGMTCPLFDIASCPPSDQFQETTS